MIQTYINYVYFVNKTWLTMFIALFYTNMSLQPNNKYIFNK